MQNNPAYNDVVCIKDSDVRDYDAHDAAGVSYEHFYLFHTPYERTNHLSLQTRTISCDFVLH